MCVCVCVCVCFEFIKHNVPGSTLNMYVLVLIAKYILTATINLTIVSNVSYDLVAFRIYCTYMLNYT